MLRAEVLKTILYDCVTWSLRACHHDRPRRAHHRLLTRCIGWRKDNRTDHPISYLGTLINGGGKCEHRGDYTLEADLDRGICGAHGEPVTTEVCDVRRTGGGRGLRRGQEKEWMACYLDDLRAFGINVDQWTTAAQDEGEWRKTAEQGAERFMAKWIAAEKFRAGILYAVVCPN